MGLGSKDVSVGAARSQLGGMCVVPVVVAGTAKVQGPGGALSQEVRGDQLERIWETHWQGEPANVGQQRAPDSPKGDHKGAPEGKAGTVPQLLRNLKELGHKLRTLGKRKSESDDELDVPERLDSTMEFRVPRYPSWVEWD